MTFELWVNRNVLLHEIQKTEEPKQNTHNGSNHPKLLVAVKVVSGTTLHSFKFPCSTSVN